MDKLTELLKKMKFSERDINLWLNLYADLTEEGQKETMMMFEKQAKGIK